MPPRFAQPVSFGLPPFTRGVKWLLIATVAVFVVVNLSGELGQRLALLLAFRPGALLEGFVWQPFTYTFLTGDPFSLILACLGLWMMGGSLEAMWGTRRFVTFYFASAALAAIATAIVAIAWGSVARHAYGGNWTVLAALAAAFAIALPSARIFLYFVPIEARLLLPITAAIMGLYMIYERSAVPYLPQLFGLGAGVVLAGGVRGPKQMWLRWRVFWIDRRLRNRNLRIVRGEDEQPPRGARGSDKYLH